METVAACLLGLTTAGYLALAGAGLGLGMLLRFLGRTPAERRRVLGRTAARQRAHDVWLLAAAALAEEPADASAAVRSAPRSEPATV